MRPSILPLACLLSVALMVPPARANDMNMVAGGAAMSIDQNGMAMAVPGASMRLPAAPNGGAMQMQVAPAPTQVVVQRTRPSNVYMRGARLVGHNFSNQDLTKADFKGADLRGADFSNSLLDGAYFREADLTNANFTNASLIKSDFKGANMDGAILVGANFTDSYLREVRARNVYISDATNFAGCDMKNAEITEMVRVAPQVVAVAPPAPVAMPAPVPPPVQARPAFYDAATIAQTLAKSPQDAQPRKIDLSVNFEFNADKLTRDGLRQVQEVAQALKQLSPTENRIMIEGHTDAVGSQAYNQDLSYRRATRVMRTLVEEYGIPAEQLSAKGYGASHPISTNDTELGRAMNRRVTLVNIGR